MKKKKGGTKEQTNKQTREGRMGQMNECQKERNKRKKERERWAKKEEWIDE